MKALMLVVIGGVLAAPWLRAQTLSNDSEQKARELLRSVIEQRERKRISAIQPLPPPRTSSKATSPSIESSTLVARTTTPATTANLAPTGYKTVRQPTFSEVEQDYLAGKISAKQFQKFLRDQKLVPDSPEPPVTTSNFEAVKAIPNPSPGAVGQTPPTPASPSTPAELQPEKNEPPADQGNLSDLEKKMDELLRLKAAREQANLKALTQATNNSAAANTPKNKRERLDDLLRLYLGGKISEPEYNEKRAKVLAENGN